MNLPLADKLQWIIDSARLILPEWILIAGIVVLLLLTMLRAKEVYAVAVTAAALILSLVAVWQMWPETPTPLFINTLRLDDFSAAFKILFLFGGILTLAMYKRGQHLFGIEFCLLVLAVVVGAHFLAMSIHGVTVLLSLELISISSYVLAGFNFNKRAAEASLKYFLFGSIATAVMVYGFSLLAMQGVTLQFSSGSFFTTLVEVQTPLVLVAGFFILSSLLFKMAAVPFHLWAPDVYEAAPLPVVAFLSVVPKLAGAAVLFKFLLALQLFGQSSINWPAIIAVIATVSITVGNLSALLQRTTRRMMAYSSIAQAGFLLAALAPLSQSASHIFMLYAWIFLLGNFAVFFALQFFEEHTGSIEINKMAGLGSAKTWLSVALLVGLVSLTGLPPTAGFTAKLFVFTAVWDAYDTSGSNAFLWLFLLGLLNTVVSLFYYLKIPFYLFMRPAQISISPTKKNHAGDFFLALVVIALMVLFFYPSLLMGWLNKITFVL